MKSRRFSEVAVGERFGDRASVSEWHLRSGVALFGDPGPNHVDPIHASGNRFGRPILHGFTTTGIAMSVVGFYFGWSLEAFLETHIRFSAPVYPGDNLDIFWEVKSLQPKAAFNGGIVELIGRCWSGPEKRLAVEMEARIAVNNSTAPEVCTVDENHVDVASG